MPARRGASGPSEPSFPCPGNGAIPGGSATMRYLSAAARLAVALTLGFFASLAFAQYPDHPIKMVVAYPAGGATDVVARAVAQRLGERLKQSVVIENRPGASGQIGTDFVARS